MAAARMLKRRVDFPRDGDQMTLELRLGACHESSGARSRVAGVEVELEDGCDGTCRGSG